MSEISPRILKSNPLMATLYLYRSHNGDSAHDTQNENNASKTRIVFRDILRDSDLVSCTPYSLTNQATQSSHPEESGRAHRL